MLIIGLTGGIGAGKSLVSRRLQELGAYVIDADVVARQVVEPGRAALTKIVQRFGAGVLTDEGTLDRQALAAEVFDNPGARADLEAITHPEILREINRQGEQFLRDNPTGKVVVDAPLLIETGLYQRMHQVWVVTAARGQRVERVIQRDAVSKEQVMRRMQAQSSDEEKISVADEVIDNSGSKGETLKQVDRLWQKMSNSSLRG